MINIDLATIETWCILPWRLKALEDAGGFQCQGDDKADAVLQTLTLTAEDEVLPKSLLGEFQCLQCGHFTVDFQRLLPTEEPFAKHQDCGMFFEAWGTHSIPELIEVESGTNSLMVVFATARFPAENWVEELIQKYPGIRTVFTYETATYRGEVQGAYGEVTKRIHVGLS